jgi:protein O-GlcNAc transferase
LLRRAARSRPEDSSLFHCLGMAHALAGEWDRALAAFHLCLSLHPEHPLALADSARTMLMAGRYREALSTYRSEAQFERSAPELCGIGEALSGLGIFNDAKAAFRRSLRLNPDSAETWAALAGCLHKFRRDGERLQCLRKLEALEPDNAIHAANLAAALTTLGRLNEATRAYRRALQLDPHAHAVRSAYLSMLLHRGAYPPSEVFQAHRDWESHHARRPRRAARVSAPSSARRKLRVGYLTGELQAGQCAYFVGPVLTNHDPAKVQTYCYYTYPISDRQTDTIRRSAHAWRDVADWSDRKLVSQIGEDRIDILVDLSGHIPGNRLAVFARRAAPVQVSYPAHPATSGLSQMDYFLTDELTDPPGLTEHQFTERLFRLPAGWIAYGPPQPDAPLTPLPALANGVVTFGIFQRAAKLNPEFWDRVAAVMHRVPNSRLLLHHSSRDYDHPASWLRNSLTRAAGERGIPAGRLDFSGGASTVEHLKQIARADLAFDTFPYNGQTITCECLWMGVPVVTLAGVSHVSRVTHGILHRVGLGEWSAATPDEYVEIAARKAANPASLARLRRRLRKAMQASTLLDHRAVAAGIEAAYRQMWRETARRGRQ